jgi:hypothetical protein
VRLGDCRPHARSASSQGELGFGGGAGGAGEATKQGRTSSAARIADHEPFLKRPAWEAAGYSSLEARDALSVPFFTLQKRSPWTTSSPGHRPFADARFPQACQKVAGRWRQLHRPPKCSSIARSSAGGVFRAVPAWRTALGVPRDLWYYGENVDDGEANRARSSVSAVTTASVTIPS